MCRLIKTYAEYEFKFADVGKRLIFESREPGTKCSKVHHRFKVTTSPQLVKFSKKKAERRYNCCL